MPELDAEHLRLPVRRPPAVGSRLWREWCFARAAFRHFRVKFLLIGGLLLGGGLLFRLLEPEKHHSYPRAVYYTWVLVFGQPPEEFPASAALQAMFFIVPLLGLLVILEGLVEFALILRDRRRYERSWCKVMAASLSNHIILVGLGKLGYRTYRLLRQLGEEVVVIEHNADNQFLEDIRRDGSPLFVGDARREAFLEDANAAAAKSIILATNHDMVNLEVALDARRINPQIRVVMRMFDQNIADKVREGFNLQVAMSQSALSAPAFVTAALEGSTVSSLLVGDQLMVIERWPVDLGGPFHKKTVAQIMADHGVVVIERRPRGGEPRLIPPPDTTLEAGDELLIQGTFPAFNKMRATSAGQPQCAR
ncbi:MAG TPA: NAD-binding protein [Phycisphaerae bacterium]|nr:NAD-binding protein [Phycisphaerae bacterium]